MQGLNRSRFLYLGLMIATAACATSSYKHIRQDGRKAEINVTSDRVLLECSKISDENELYMFQIHILDDEETVLTAVQGNNSDQEDCERRKQKVGRVLATGRHIYLGGMGYPDAPRKITADTFDFPKIGTFHWNGRVLQFMVIANENGVCYGAYTGDSKPCPRDEFPITDKS